MDGAFLDLNSETISNEVQEFWTDIFKINKFFQQVKKKEMLEKANKEGVKRKKAEDSKDEEEVPAIIVCNKIMDGIKDFKVKTRKFVLVRRKVIRDSKFRNASKNNFWKVHFQKLFFFYEARSLALCVVFPYIRKFGVLVSKN